MNYVLPNVCSYTTLVKMICQVLKKKLFIHRCHLSGHGQEIAKKICAKVTILSVRSGLNCFCYRDHQFRYDTCLIIRNSTDRKGQIPNGHHNITVAAYRYYCTFIGYRGNWWFPTAQSIVLQRIFHSVVNVTSTICRMI